MAAVLVMVHASLTATNAARSMIGSMAATILGLVLIGGKAGLW